MLALFSPNNAFATAVINAISFVNSTFICTTVSDSAAEPLKSKMEMYLYYGPTDKDYQVVPLDRITDLLTGGHWNFSRTATCFFPGWTKTATSGDYSLAVVNGYLKNDTTNILVLEWSSVTKMEYTRAVSLLPNVAKWVATAFDKMANSSNVTSIVFVGHSIGAHIAGYIARRCTVMKITFLAALDPAGPLFAPNQWRCQEGVTATDAEFVMAMHTDCGRFGTAFAIGTVDYYPNNGTFIQPGCTPYDTNPATCYGQFLCSHSRSVLFWSDAVANPGSFIGRRCPSSSAFAAGKCSNYSTNDITSPTSEFGPYYFRTGGASPFGLGNQGA